MTSSSAIARSIRVDAGAVRFFVDCESGLDCAAMMMEKSLEVEERS